MQLGISFESLQSMTEQEVLSYMGVLEAVEEKMMEEQERNAR